MSMTPPEMSSEVTQPPPKTGMSRGAKLLIILGVGGGLLVLLCCGGVIGYFVYYGASMMSNDPAVVAAKTDEITQIEIPDGIEPKKSFDVKVPFSDERLMLLTAHTDEETGSLLALFSLADASASQDQREMERVMGDLLRQQGIEEPEEIAIDQSYTKEVEIRGETATFTIEKGTGMESNTPRIRVKGVFQGKTGPVFLKFSADAEKYTEEQIIQMIESIE